MSRAFLFFAAAFVALMAGALLYAARFAAEEVASAAPPTASPPPVLEAVSHPSFTLPDVDGTPRDIAEWRGKKLILNFWATWCGPCKREIPVLKAFQDEHGGDGFQVIGIAVDFPEEVSYYAEDAKFNYPILVGQKEAMAVAESSGIQFVGLPFTMFVSPDGEYLNAYLGELHQEHLDKIVEIMSALDQGSIDTTSVKDALGAL